MKQVVHNSSKLANIFPPFRSNQDDREKGFLSAIFCPIPVGDSPSSKRMYDSLNFGCIPVVLSNDLVWAFTDQTGFTGIHHTQFSIQIPQSIVQYTAMRTLEDYKDKKQDLGILPSGARVYDLLIDSIESGGEYINGRYINPLVQVLRRVSESDIEHLSKKVFEVSHSMRYYSMNKSMVQIPTSHHSFPDGGAISAMASMLQQRKDHGIHRLYLQCVKEKSRKHMYVGRYSCDTDKKDSLIHK